MRLLRSIVASVSWLSLALTFAEVGRRVRSLRNRSCCVGDMTESGVRVLELQDMGTDRRNRDGITRFSKTQKLYCYCSCDRRAIPAGRCSVCEVIPVLGAPGCNAGYLSAATRSGLPSCLVPIPSARPPPPVIAPRILRSAGLLQSAWVTPCLVACSLVQGLQAAEEI
jgi:hypothetical protein